MTALVGLTVDNQHDPLGLGRVPPRFGWVIDPGPARDVRQAAYELSVFEEPTHAEVWATGRVPGDQSVGVRYAGPALAARGRYGWRVRVWVTGSPGPSPWATGRFELALLSASDWSARWVEPVQEPTVVERIASLAEAFDPRARVALGPAADRLRPAQRLRQAFRLPSPPVRARLYATAHGVYEAELNGALVGDQVLAPGFETYDKRMSFQTYDVTNLLRAGENALGVTVADGWYAGRITAFGNSANFGDRLQALWQLEVELADGSRVVVPSDGSVRSATGPVVYADLFIGERYDARLETPGWSSPGFDDSTWAPVTVLDPAGLDPAGSGPLTPFHGEPVRRLVELPAVGVEVTPTGEAVVDFGQVIAGRVRLRVTGPAGTCVVLEHSEVLDASGNFLLNIMGPSKDQRDEYVLSGDPAGEVYEPQFTFHGFRFLRVTGYPGTLAPERVTAMVIGSDLRPTGQFETSDPRLDQLHRNVVWSQRGNFLSIPTDCPQRERDGWTGDLAVFAPAATNNFAVLEFLRRWLENLRLDQLDDGAVPHVVPISDAYKATATGGSGGFGLTSAAWGDAVVLVPHALHERYGDLDILRENYPAMVRWVQYQAAQARAELPARLQGPPLDDATLARQQLLWNTGTHFGDWFAPSTLAAAPFPEAVGVAPRLTGEIVAAMFHARCLSLLAEIAQSLGETGDAARYAGWAAAVRDAFAQEYLDAGGALPVELQGPYVLALAFGLVPDAVRPLTVARLAAMIEANGGRLDTGFASVRYLLDVLWDNGHAELARRLLWQDRLPSWLYEVDRGATTIWETWGNILPDGTVRPMSYNHYAFGCVDDVLYRRLAGLVARSPGFKQSAVQPDLDCGLSRVAASLATPYGTLAVAWERSGDLVTVEVTVPANTTTEVVLPADAMDCGLEALDADGSALPMPVPVPVLVPGSGPVSGAATRWRLGSGRYAVHARLRGNP